MTKVLLVDDEDSFVDALTVGLRRQQYEVVVARDGEEALRRFAEVDPDLVLLDLMLPRIDGLEVCRTIRSTSRVPIIIVSARTSESDTLTGLGVGANDYVTKPYRLSDLMARVGHQIRNAPAAPPSV